ncbi:MAG: aminoglycoside phosphotransferase family protein [Oscillospiraceae bacterium]|jgi:Ser/Thr protein kinase RdoA (MazF antagonist)|nr:aminoglycoside phosphotransferase family protein [Oscillospiraceae bacterium]MBQ2072237.1 aminoglycoside phosphotransferase family protein [Oscillospiraceae bacterium]MBQ5427530.1 aminoglycoside phosphotransferase family protein [Oscillospiraceae bacterium]MBQ5787093.1 aminoglycoside phosphotransferase family protein [Oscillospiraceae bacterium]
MEQVLDLFRLNGRPVSCDPYGEGHINLTFLAVTDTGKRYILQRLSRAAFHDIPGLMGNVAAVTEFLAARSPDPRSSLHLIPTLDGRSFCRDSEGEFWRVYDFVEDSLCLQTPETPEDFYQSAVAFGQFQCRLRDFPAETLCETIPNFHNTPDRYRKFHLAVDADAAGRLSSVLPEIRFLLEREEKAGTLQRLREGGELPVRVTHNDTKLNNVMLDAVTRKALCVIDLDTVMPGLVAYDFGDSIRFGASTAPEDEKDLSRVEMSLDLYETYARGFIPACGGLTAAELESLPLGAWTMTLENGLRFLTDYLEGDHYYHITRPEHNLDRCRTQLKLVSDMEQKWDPMTAIIRSFQP